ncbi:MAG: 3-phosphoshikimate 1-carboxyvinyltransferase, partial [Planctomycetota bacterium]
MTPQWKLALEIPGSKSVTNRALLLASLAQGTSLLKNILESEDIFYLKEALKQLGVSIRSTSEGDTIQGRSPFLAPQHPLNLGDSGTGLRFLTAFCALASDPITLTGSLRLQERPILELLNALKQLGAQCSSSPVVVRGPLRGGVATIKSSESSQYLSALLMVSPYAQTEVQLLLDEEPVSWPYIELTLQMMEQFGIQVKQPKFGQFIIPQGTYHAQTFSIEADCSSSSYFLAAAVLGKGEIQITNWNAKTLQGDRQFLDLLKEMGCFIQEDLHQVRVSGPPQLKAIRCEMRHTPDLVPILAILASFAQGTSRFSGVAHLRYKESDRLSAITQELQKSGIRATAGPDWIEIEGGQMTPAWIHCYQD